MAIPPNIRWLRQDDKRQLPSSGGNTIVTKLYSDLIVIKLNRFWGRGRSSPLCWNFPQLFSSGNSWSSFGTFLVKAPCVIRPAERRWLRDIQQKYSEKPCVCVCVCVCVSPRVAREVQTFTLFYLGHCKIFDEVLYSLCFPLQCVPLSLSLSLSLYIPRLICHHGLIISASRTLSSLLTFLLALLLWFVSE